MTSPGPRTAATNSSDDADAVGSRAANLRSVYDTATQAMVVGRISELHQDQLGEALQIDTRQHGVMIGFTLGRSIIAAFSHQHMYFYRPLAATLTRPLRLF
jgi:hypothetical protein